jgi:hypothetical protein
MNDFPVFHDFAILDTAKKKHSGWDLGNPRKNRRKQKQWMSDIMPSKWPDFHSQIDSIQLRPLI